MKIKTLILLDQLNSLQEEDIENASELFQYIHNNRDLCEYHTLFEHVDMKCGPKKATFLLAVFTVDVYALHKEKFMKFAAVVSNQPLFFATIHQARTAMNALYCLNYEGGL